MNKVIIDLTDEEAKLFLAFREHQNTFQVLMEAGIFDVRNGKAILNFDSNGGLEEIKLDITRYKRGKQIIFTPIVIHS